MAQEATRYTMEFEKFIPAGPLDSDAGIVEIAGDQDYEGPPCAQLHDTLPHIKRRYRKLALISLPRHFDDVCVRDEDTLFISCNWLLWQQNLGMVRHCIHYETLHDGSDPLNLSEDRNLRAVDWVYRNNRDVTMFRGVSLGRKFTEEIAQLIAEWHRLERGLEAAIKRFHPEEIAFFDYKTKNNRLPPVGCLQLVREVATRFDVGVIDRRESSAAPGSDFSDERILISTETRSGNGVKPVDFKFGLLSMFEKLADHWSHLRRSRDGARLAILILATHRTVLPLIEGSWGSKLEPILFARNFPNKKKVLHLIYSMARGILLISTPRDRLTHRELQAVESIAECLKATWKFPASGHELAVREYIKNEVIDKNRLQRLAEKVKSAESVLDDYRPDAIFVDGILNFDINIFLELAKTRDIPTASTWHSPILVKCKYPVFGADPRAASVVDLCLTWGKGHEDWLRDTGARCKWSRTGWLAKGNHQQSPRVRVRDGRALMLQFVVSGDDFAGRFANEFACFVHVARMLRDLECESIRLKLHPSRLMAPYYERIAQFFKIECDFFNDGPADEHIEWSDFVIGPIHTAAMLEAMAQGKPYFPLHLSPSTVDPRSVKGCRIYRDFDSLRQALRAEFLQDQSATINYYTGADENRDAVERVWKTLYGLASAKQNGPRSSGH